MPNRLATETSPYLIQHADNPVDWYPWGPEALNKARSEDKPILLSIGYAACHWCHVMAHESFEDESAAKVMNEHFINIKVDREERPDLDSIYMQAVQAMTGHGGWPMTMFLLPDGSPFYGGTYFPPEERHGIPSFKKILLAVADAYKNRRDEIEKSASKLNEIYQTAAMQPQSTAELTQHTLDLAYRGIAQRYDENYGGFGGAPKFPATMAMDFLLRYYEKTGTDYALEMVKSSFIKMARGGIYDQVGGGFARYSVDERWLVPHFEKMLYDNALLIRLGAQLWQATKNDEVRRVTEETIEWVEREMISPEGGFYSSLDADSEGHEGKFYVWSEEEIDKLLGTESATVKSYYGVSAQGNFEGKNILFVRNDTEIDDVILRAKRTLYDARSKRVWPGRDDKIIAAWNGLMLRGLASAALIFGREGSGMVSFAESHARCDSQKTPYQNLHTLVLGNAEFLRDRMVRNGRVMRSYKDGVTRIPGFLEDHAAIALAFISVYELTGEKQWLDLAKQISNAMIEWFWDDEKQIFFDTAKDSEKLITRPRDVTDNATPSGTSLAAELMLKLSDIDNDPTLRERGVQIMRANAEPMSRYPTAFGHLLSAAYACRDGVCDIPVPANRNRGSSLEQAPNV